MAIVLVAIVLGVLWAARIRPRAEAPLTLRASYVGAAACRSCHAAEFAAWRGSQHALAMQPATDQTVQGDFHDAEFRDGGITSRFFRRDGRFMVRTDGPDGALADFEIRYTFGVAPLQQYLIGFPDGRMQALSIAWDARPKESGGQRWFHLHAGEHVTHQDELHWTGLQQNWNFMCADCHSTNLRKHYDAASNAFQTAWSEIDVACEACHGPGSEHAAWGRRPAWWRRFETRGRALTVTFDERRGISWPIDSASGVAHRSAPRTTDRELEVCARCHSRRSQISEEFRPGQPIGDGFRVALLEDGLYWP
ncbi:MAG: multiheme c-type cytochrome, partial [Candidatus Eiseniibacteriota bacterium]